MACDFIRRPYRTRVRPFSDHNTSVIIRWFPCAPGHRTLPFPSAITSLDWDSDPEAATGVGEVYGAPRNFVNSKPVAGSGTGRFCGTASMFMRGTTFDFDKPPVIYDANGLPVCCRGPLGADGGIVTGGGCTVEVVIYATGNGGLLTGGSADVYVTSTQVGYGGIVTDGGCVVWTTAPEEGDGGICTGGDCEVEVTAPLGEVYSALTIGLTYLGRTSPTTWEDIFRTLTYLGSNTWELVDISLTPVPWVNSGWNGLGSGTFTHPVYLDAIVTWIS